MSNPSNTVRNIWFIDEKTRNQSFILTNRIIWNNDRSILVAMIHVPSVKGMIFRELQISSENILSIEKFKLIDIKHYTMSHFIGMKGKIKDEIRALS